MQCLTFCVWVTSFNRIFSSSILLLDWILERKKQNFWDSKGKNGQCLVGNHWWKILKGWDFGCAHHTHSWSVWGTFKEDAQMPSALCSLEDTVKNRHLWAGKQVLYRHWTSRHLDQLCSLQSWKETCFHCLTQHCYITAAWQTKTVIKDFHLDACSGAPSKRQTRP